MSLDQRGGKEKRYEDKGCKTPMDREIRKAGYLLRKLYGNSASPEEMVLNLEFNGRDDEEGMKDYVSDEESEVLLLYSSQVRHPPREMAKN